MTLFTPLASGKTIQLNDKAGVDALVIKDSDTFPVAKFDSVGNLKLKGKVMRI